MFPELGEFLSAVFNNWVEKVGIVLTLLPFIEKLPVIKHWLSDKPILDYFKPLLWIVGILCIVWGFYSAWLEQYRAFNVAQAKLDALMKPIISGEFVFEAAAGTGEQKEKCLATFVVHIKNLGAPTALEHFSITVTRDTKAFDVQLLPPSNIILFSGTRAAGPEVRFSPEYHLLQKAARNPILTNVPIDAWFQIVINGLTRDEFVDEGTTVSLSYDEVATGKKSSITYVSKGGPSEPPIDLKKLFRESR